MVVYYDEGEIHLQGLNVETSLFLKFNKKSKIIAFNEYNFNTHTHTLEIITKFFNIKDGTMLSQTETKITDEHIFVKEDLDFRHRAHKILKKNISIVNENLVLLPYLSRIKNSKPKKFLFSESLGENKWPTSIDLKIRFFNPSKGLFIGKISGNRRNKKKYNSEGSNFNYFIKANKPKYMTLKSEKNYRKQKKGKILANTIKCGPGLAVYSKEGDARKCLTLLNLDSGESYSAKLGLDKKITGLKDIVDYFLLDNGNLVVVTTYKLAIFSKKPSIEHVGKYEYVEKFFDADKVLTYNEDKNIAIIENEYGINAIDLESRRTLKYIDKFDEKDLLNNPNMKTHKAQWLEPNKLILVSKLGNANFKVELLDFKLNRKKRR